MANNSEKFFQRLTRLFKSGPVVKRRVKNIDVKSASSVLELFKKSASNVYSEAMGMYGSYDRLARLADASEMDYTPEIATALNIYADETVATDERDRSLHVYSENHKVKKLLEELFYDTLNVEFNLRGWVRNLCKFGDFFLFNDVDPAHGVINAFPIPVNEIEREEGYDPDDPMAVRFRWITQGNTILENWQITHMRLLGNDAFLPYGSSVLESARRIWRQLVLIEDAMLVYRIIRSPERRVFYIDVGAVPPEEVPRYVEQARATLRTNSVVDRTTGKVDLRHAPLAVDHDYFVPVRGGETGTKIETLAGGTNATAIEDVEYIQKKLFAALGVPRAYLGYEESLSSKATLAAEDIRFSRSIAYIQKVVISELNKLAIIHLFANGYEGEDLLDFTLQLSNPSAIAQQQKLELYRTKFEIAGSSPEGLLSKTYVLKNVLGMTDEEIELKKKKKMQDKINDAELEQAAIPEEEGAPAPPPEEGGEEGGEEGEAGGLFTGKDRGGNDLLISKEEPETSDIPIRTASSKETSAPKSPVKVQPQLKRALYNRSRRRTHGASKTHMPDFKTMMSPSNQLNDPHDSSWLRGSFGEAKEYSINIFDKQIHDHTKMTSDITRTLKRLKELQYGDEDVENEESSPVILTEDICED